MAFSDVRTTLNANVLDVFGAVASYTSVSTGTSVNIYAVLYESLEDLHPDTGQYEVRDVAHVNRVDLTQPRQGDRLQIGARTWQIDRYREEEGLWRLTLRKELT